MKLERGGSNDGCGDTDALWAIYWEIGRFVES